jgi:hypothetical protein
MLSKSASSVLASPQGLALRVPRVKGQRELVRAKIADWAPSRRLMTAERLGWTDLTMSDFILGSGRVVGSIEVLPVGNALTCPHMARHSARLISLNRDTFVADLYLNAALALLIIQVSHDSEADDQQPDDDIKSVAGHKLVSFFWGQDRLSAVCSLRARNHPY